MTNKHYEKGRRKENKICKDLKNAGFDIAQRSAGSHSPVDIFAISRSKRIIKFIQSKPEDYNPKKILEELSWLNGEFKVEFEVL